MTGIDWGPEGYCPHCNRIEPLNDTGTLARHAATGHAGTRTPAARARHAAALHAATGGVKGDDALDHVISEWCPGSNEQPAPTPGDPHEQGPP
ncbi:hypothetical protein ACMA1D_10785 [Streptomyces sp. 796.1]|uniref:hypothetical protein n=1 Tax=Streptomyces sp. 796.1 TaxID=3163029 RepID=UPI0039C91447